MVQVVLPYGYPKLSGEVEQTVIYQGTLARIYAVPKDPRTDSQLFERKLFSDIAKMRGSVGPWARGLWKISFGSKWATVVYQMARSDALGYWSARRDEWDGFTVETKEYLTGEAPYRVLYNDPGMIWWCLYGMLYDWAQDHACDWWQMPEPDETYQDNMFEWWRGWKMYWEYWGGLVATSTHEEDVFYQDGNWEVVTDPLASGGAYFRTYVNGGRFWFVMAGRYARLHYIGGVGNWYLKIRIDGVEQFEQINQSLSMNNYVIGPVVNGIHLIELEFFNGGNPANKANVDKVFICSKKSEL